MKTIEEINKQIAELQQEKKKLQEFKPCPFCGSDARIITKENNYYDIGCTNEDCYLCDGADWNKTEFDQIFEMWNIRPEQDHEFVRFLKDNGAYEAFIENFNNPNITCTERSKNLENYLAENDSKIYISNSFVWYDTEQEHKYWDNLNDKWLKH